MVSMILTRLYNTHCFWTCFDSNAQLL